MLIDLMLVVAEVQRMEEAEVAEQVVDQMMDHNLLVQPKTIQVQVQVEEVDPLEIEDLERL
jgi:hypothetical protein